MDCFGCIVQNHSIQCYFYIILSLYSLVPNVTHRSIETHACTLGKSIGLNYPHAWTNGKLLCGKKYTTNNFVSHNPIETHDFKISSCQKCDFQLNHTSDLHFQIGMIQIKHTPVFGFGLILIEHMGIFYDFKWAY